MQVRGRQTSRHGTHSRRVFASNAIPRDHLILERYHTSGPVRGDVDASRHSQFFSGPTTVRSVTTSVLLKAQHFQVLKVESRRREVVLRALLFDIAGLFGQALDGAEEPLEVEGAFAELRVM